MTRPAGSGGGWGLGFRPNGRRYLGLETGFDQAPNGSVARSEAEGELEVVDALEEIGVQHQMDKRPGRGHAGECI